MHDKKYAQLQIVDNLIKYHVLHLTSDGSCDFVSFVYDDFGHLSLQISLLLKLDSLNLASQGKVS